MLTIVFLLVPLFVSRYWMVLAATVFVAIAQLFLQWNLWSAASDIPGAAPYTIFDIVIPATRDVIIYLAVATGLYFVKRLFVRAEPRKLSNID